MLDDVCADAVAAGITACVVLDTLTGLVVAGLAGGEVKGASAILDALMNRSPIVNVFSPRRADAPGERAGELLVVGVERAVFARLSRDERWLALVVAPPTLSVALGWSFLRRVVASAESSL